jgi:hypothetical protein
MIITQQVLKVRAISARWKKVHAGGIGKEAKMVDIPNGWIISLTDNIGIVIDDNERPNLEEGDKVLLKVEKIG